MRSRLSTPMLKAGSWVSPDRTRYRSLTDTQLRIVRTLVRPGAEENPFPERLQLRNQFRRSQEQRLLLSRLVEAADKSSFEGMNKITAPLLRTLTLTLAPGDAESIDWTGCIRLSIGILYS